MDDAFQRDIPRADAQLRCAIKDDLGTENLGTHRELRSRGPLRWRYIPLRGRNAVLSCRRTPLGDHRACVLKA